MSDEDEDAQETAQEQPAEGGAARVYGRPFEPGNEFRFAPGQSGNPAGRPKGVATVVREMLEEIPPDDPDRRTRLKALFQSMYIDARGGVQESVVDGKVVRTRRRGSVMHARELFDRAYGRVPVAFKQIDDTDAESLLGMRIVTVNEQGDEMALESAKPQIGNGGGGNGSGNEKPKPEIPE